MIEVRRLRPGGQSAADIGAAIAGFAGGSTRSLDLALYDIRLHSPVAETVREAIVGPGERGAAVRLAYNADHERPVPVPPPPSTVPDLIEAMPVPTKGIPGIPDLMHHKYAVRDGAAVWSGSTNWTQDSWEKQENVIVTVESEAVAGDFTRNFEELWSSGRVEGSGEHDPQVHDVDGAQVRCWFTPGRGRALAQRIATVIDRAERRVRIASPVLTSGPVIGTLGEIVAERRVDLAGVLDATQMERVFEQWQENPRSRWKLAPLGEVLGSGAFSGKRSIPWTPDSVHDFMHAKVTVADDTAFIGSYNLSRSGEFNAENVLEIRDPAIAEQMADWIDEVRADYPPAPVPS
ncbi:MAG: hypothetical protein H0T15_09180 [Thermoleophilaceae bacterium]|nr:hypothetical protein [Thermoleophilaceae bacterium]